MNFLMNLFNPHSINIGIIALAVILGFIFTSFGCYKIGKYKTGFVLSLILAAGMSGMLIVYLFMFDIPMQIEKNDFHFIINRISRYVDKNLVQCAYRAGADKDFYVLHESVQEQDKGEIRDIFRSIQYNKKYTIRIFLVNILIKTTANAIVLFFVFIILIGGLVTWLFRRFRPSPLVAFLIIAAALALAVLYLIVSNVSWFMNIIWPLAAIIFLIFTGCWSYCHYHQCLAAIFVLSFTAVFIFIYLFLLMDIKYAIVILISYFACSWFFRLRQYLLALFTLVLMMFYLAYNPACQETKLTLNSMAGQVPGNYFRESIINKIPDSADRIFIQSLYKADSQDSYALDTTALNQVPGTIGIDSFYKDILLNLPDISDRILMQKFYMLDIEPFTEFDAGIFRKDIRKKIKDANDKEIVSAAYKLDNNKYILKDSISEEDINKTALILNFTWHRQQYQLQPLINYYSDSRLDYYKIPELLQPLQFKRKQYSAILEENGIINPALKATLWVPNTMEPENKKEITLVAQFSSIDRPAVYRISAEYNENILTCSSLPDKNIMENKEQSDEYSSSVLYEGEIQSNEIISKKITFQALSHEWKETQITFKLEKAAKNENETKDVSDAGKNQDSMEKDIAAIIKELDSIKEDITAIIKELDNIKKDITAIKKDQNIVNKDNTDVNNDQDNTEKVKVWNLEYSVAHQIKEEYKLTSYIPTISLFIGVIGMLITFFIQLIEAFRKKGKENK